MAIHWPTPGFKGRTVKFCLLNRLDFNFCVRSSPLRGVLYSCSYVYELNHWRLCNGTPFFFLFFWGGTLTLPLPAVLFSNITDNMEDFILTYTISLLLSSFVVIIAIAEMKVPSAEGREQSNGSSVKHKARSECSFPCFAFGHNSDFLTSASPVHSTSFFPSLFKHEMESFLKSDSVVWVMLLWLRHWLGVKSQEQNQLPRRC